ncbi:hypothetical protein ACU61A_15670 [Pseudonocardia sichuanensis]
MAFTQVVVTRRYLTAELTPASGRVVLTPQVPMVNGDTVVAAPRVGVLDAEGDLHLAVAATTDPTTTPPGVSYLVREEIDGQTRRSYYVEVPHDVLGGTVDLSTLNPAMLPPVVTYPATGPAGPQGEPGIPGPNLVATADDVDTAGAAVGQALRVASVSPSLAFALSALSYADLAGTVPTSALPALAVNSVSVVADEAAMLALVAERGDMAIREDTGRTYVLASDAPSTLGDWIEVLAAGQVASVAGKTGVVLLNATDVGLDQVDNVSAAELRARASHTGTQAISTVSGLQAALDAKAATSALDAKAARYVTTSTYTASATLVLGDEGKAVEMNVATANTLTIPPNSAVAFPVGTIVEVYQRGAGQTTVAAGAGVTLRAPNGAKLASQYATASLRKRQTDEWVLAGDVVA